MILQLAISVINTTFRKVKVKYATQIFEKHKMK